MGEGVTRVYPTAAQEPSVSVFRTQSGVHVEIIVVGSCGFFWLVYQQRKFCPLTEILNSSKF